MRDGRVWGGKRDGRGAATAEEVSLAAVPREVKNFKLGIAN